MSNEPDNSEAAGSRPAGSVARAIVGYQNGNSDELGEIINAYFGRLLTKAKAKLGCFPHTDHEGLVQSTLGSFLKGARNGQYPAMNHRSELERLLGTILFRKVAHAVRDQTAEIAGGGRVQNEPENGLETKGREPNPLEEAISREWLAHMERQNLLNEAQLISEGCHFHELSERLGVTESSARRLITLVHKQTEIYFGLERK